MKALLAKHHLRLCAFSVYVGGYPKYAEPLGGVGGGVAIQGSAGPCKPEELTARMRAFLESLKPLLELAEKNNSRLAIENHGNALLDAPDSFKAFVDLNTSPRLGLALAPYHVQAGGASVHEAIRICGRQLLFFYAWQNQPEMGQLPGHGPTDFTPWLRALAQVDYRGYVNAFMHGHVEADTMSAALTKSPGLPEAMRQDLNPSEEPMERSTTTRQTMLTTRRDFLKTSGGALAGAALAAPLATPRPGYAAEDNTIRIALVGCGGRGTGAAANALATKGPTKLVALADVFPDRVENSLQDPEREVLAQVDVPPERRFVGFDAFKKAIDCVGQGRPGAAGHAGGLPPAPSRICRPEGRERVHGEVFRGGCAGRPAGAARGRAGRAEEPQGGQRPDVAARPAARGSRSPLHDGAIGDLILLRTYRMHGPVGFHPRQPGESELAHQIRNYSCYTWLNASFFVDWLIHNIDVCCWAKDAWP